MKPRAASPGQQKPQGECCPSPPHGPLARLDAGLEKMKATGTSGRRGSGLRWLRPAARGQGDVEERLGLGDINGTARSGPNGVRNTLQRRLLTSAVVPAVSWGKIPCSGGCCVLAWETKVLAFLQPRLVPKTGVGGQLLCLIAEWSRLSWGTEGTGLQARVSPLTFPCEDRTISGWADGCCRTRGLFLGFSNPRHKSRFSGSPRQPPGPPDRRPWASPWFSGHFRALCSGRDRQRSCRGRARAPGMSSPERKTGLVSLLCTQQASRTGGLEGR